MVEVDCTADWDFKRHNPNPENLKFLHSMQQAVQESGAALGIGIDGDGDRIGIIDDQGREIFSDKMGLLLARWICPRFPGRSVVVDVKSTGLFFRDPVLAGFPRGRDFGKDRPFLYQGPGGGVQRDCGI